MQTAQIPLEATSATVCQDIVLIQQEPVQVSLTLGTETLVRLYCWVSRFVLRGIILLSLLLIDINECEFIQCQANANCSDTIGGYECNCLPGYRTDSAGICSSKHSTQHWDTCGSCEAMIFHHFTCESVSSIMPVDGTDECNDGTHRCDSKSSVYCISGLFYRRKSSWISWICCCARKYCSQILYLL